jgi:hypothetical protein
MWLAGSTPFIARTKKQLCFTLAVALVLNISRLSEARIVVDPENRDPTFETAVNNVLAAWEATSDCRSDPLFAHLLDVLRQSPWPITIKEEIDASKDSHTEVQRGPDRDPRNPQVGAPSTIYWNRYNTDLYSYSSVARDPTASLIHELAHAAQAAEGTLPEGEFGRWERQAPLSEERGGLYVENIYRRAQGLPMRENYNLWFVSPNAHLPCCPGASASCSDCCAGNRTCSSGTCVCQAGYFDCFGSQGGPCCPNGSSCHAGFVDSVVDMNGNPVNGRTVPPWCCAANTTSCTYRPGGFPHPSQVACCAPGQTCSATEGCVSRP